MWVPAGSCSGHLSVDLCVCLPYPPLLHLRGASLDNLFLLGWVSEDHHQAMGKWGNETTVLLPSPTPWDPQWQGAVPVGGVLFISFACSGCPRLFLPLGSSGAGEGAALLALAPDHCILQCVSLYPASPFSVPCQTLYKFPIPGMNLPLAWTQLSCGYILHQP